MKAFAHEVELQERPVDELADRRLAIGDAGELAFCSTHELDGSAADATDVVIVIHGALRNAGHYYRAILAAGDSAGRRPVVIAPQFLADVDVKDSPERDGLLYWGTDSWKGGTGGEISSFRVLDELLATLPGAFPGLRRVTVVGNSAGGQFVNRYAVVGRALEDADGLLSVPVRFVVANPSTFLYFDDLRPGSGGFIPHPDEAVSRWRYGFQDAPDYAREKSPEDYFVRYVSRDVTYLLGEVDTSPDAPLLEIHAAAAAQGANRRERGRNYRAYLEHKAGRTVHRLIEASKIGHDAVDLFTSPHGLAALFLLDETAETAE